MFKFYILALGKNSDIDNFLSHHIGEMMSAGIPLTNEDAIKAARAVSPKTIPNNTMFEVYNLEADEPPPVSASPTKELIPNTNILRDIESLIEQMEQNQAKQNENMIKNIEGLLGSLLKKVKSAPSSHGSVEQLRVKSPIPLQKRSNKEIYELKSFINDHIQDISPDFTRQLQTEMEENEHAKITNFVEQEMHAQQLEEHFEQMGSKPNLNQGNLLLISMEENRTDVETSTEQESSSVSQYSEALDDIFHNERVAQAKNQNENENSIEEIEKWLENIMQTADEMTPENLLALNNATLSHVKRNSVESTRQKGASSRQSSSFQSVGDFDTSNSRQETHAPDEESHNSYFSGSLNDEPEILDRNEQTISKNQIFVPKEIKHENVENIVDFINESTNTKEKSEEVKEELSNIQEDNVENAIISIESENTLSLDTQSLEDENANHNLNIENELLNTSDPINDTLEGNESVMTTEDDFEKKSILSEQDRAIKFSVNQGQYTRTVARYYKKILRQRKKAQKSSQSLLIKKMNENVNPISDPIIKRSYSQNFILPTNQDTIEVPSENNIGSNSNNNNSSSSSSNSNSTTLANISPLDSSPRNFDKKSSEIPGPVSSQHLSDLVENTQKLIKQMKEEINSDILTFASGESEEEYSSIDDNSDEWTDDVSDEEVFEDSYMTNLEEDEGEVTPIMFDAEENAAGKESAQSTNGDLDLVNKDPFIIVDESQDYHLNENTKNQWTSSEEPTKEVETANTAIKNAENMSEENINHEVQIQKIIEAVRNAEIMFELEDNESLQENIVEIPLKVDTIHAKALLVDDLAIALVEDIKIETTPTELSSLPTFSEGVNNDNTNRRKNTEEQNSENKVFSIEMIEKNMIGSIVLNEVSSTVDQTDVLQMVSQNTKNNVPENESNNVHKLVSNLTEESDTKQNEAQPSNSNDSDSKNKISLKKGKRLSVTEQKRKTSLENTPTTQNSSNITTKQTNTQKKGNADSNMSNPTKIGTRKSSLDSQNNQRVTIDTCKKSIPSSNFRSPVISNISKIQSQLLTKTSNVPQPKPSKIETLKSTANKSGSVATFASKLSKLISPTATTSSSKHSSSKSVVTNSNSGSSSQAGPSTSRLPVPIEMKIPKKKYHETCFSDDYQTTDDEDEQNKASSTYVPVRLLIKASSIDIQTETAEPESLEVSMNHPK